MSQDNFRAIQVGSDVAVEVDFTITIKADTVLKDFHRVMLDVQRIDGVISARIDDLPAVVVQQSVRDLMADSDGGMDWPG